MSTSRNNYLWPRRLTALNFGAALALCALLLSTAAIPAARANPASNLQDQQSTGITLTARAGFDSYYKDGEWMPVRVTVANDGPDINGSLRLSVPRSSGGEAVYTRPVNLPTQSRREIFFYVPPEGYFNSPKIDLVSGNKVVATANMRLALANTTDFIYGVLAASPSAFNDLSNINPINGVAHVAQLELADLPPLAAGWKALDVLVISDVDTGALSSEQRQALADWVQQGGRLMVMGGPGWQKTAAGLGPLLPLTPAGTGPVADLRPLESFAAATAPLAGPAVAAQGALTPDAVTLLESEGSPLISYRHEGFGLVTFLAIDPALAPLKGWDGLEGLFQSVLATATDRPSWANGIFNWSAASDAAKAVPGFDVPSAWQICGFLGIYVIIVGPLNYLILRRLKRRGLAWFTIPAIVAFFSVAAYFVGYELRGTQVVLHRLAVVQVWPGAERAQAEQVVGLFSPRRTTYEVTFEPGTLVKPIPYSSFPLAGRGEVVEQADRTRLPQVRTEIGAVEAFVAQGQVATPRFDASLTLSLAGKSGYGVSTLDGSVTNLSGLTLTDTVLLAPGGAQRLGEVKPGQTIAISGMTLSLANSRATPANLSSPLPGTSTAIAIPAPYPGAPISSGPDSTFYDILGNSYPTNQEQYRRNMLLSSALDQYNGGGRGNGIYLVGWTATSPLGAQVSAPFRTVDMSLYFIALPYTVDLGQGALVLPPGRMTWAAFDLGPGKYMPPYDTYLDVGAEMGVKFEPSVPITFKTVRGLTLHLYDKSGSTGSAAALKVSLYDFAEDAWVAQPNAVWGDTAIDTPARFVGPGGEIMVRVSNTTLAAQPLMEVDFTLEVER